MKATEERSVVDTTDIAGATDEMQDHVGNGSSSLPSGEEPNEPEAAFQAECPETCGNDPPADEPRVDSGATIADGGGAAPIAHPAAGSSPLALTGALPAWFELLFGSFPDAIYLLDPRDTDSLGPLLECCPVNGQANGSSVPRQWSLVWPILHCNETACRLSGYRREELAGLPAGLIGPRVNNSKFLADLVNALRQGNDARFQGIDQLKDGAFVPVEVWATLINVEGRALVLSVHHDLAAQRQAEARAEKYETFARIHPSACIELERGGNLAYFNPAAERLARSFGEASPVALLPPGAGKVAAECLATGRPRMNLVACVDGRELNWSFCPARARQTVLVCGSEVTHPIAPDRPAGPPAAEGGDTAFGQKLDEMFSLLRRLSESVEAVRAPAREAPAPEPLDSGLMQTAGDAFVTLNAQGTIVSFNPAAERLTGYGAGDLIGKHFARVHLLAADSLIKMLEKFDQFLTGRATRPIELLLVRNDDRPVVVEANAWAVRRAGQVAGTHITFRDITERKAGEEALRKREASLALVERISHIGSWERDVQEGSFGGSGEMLRILGLDPNGNPPEPSGFLKLIHPSCRELVARTYEQALKEGIPYSLEYRVIRPDGSESWVLEQADVMFNESGEVTRLVGTIQDITRRKQHEEQLRQVEKWEAIGRLAGGVAHDFNSILTEIRNCARFIENHPNLGGELVDQVKRLSRATERATDLTWNLLAQTRRPTLGFKPVNVNEVITQIAETLQPALGPDIELKLSLAPDLPAIPADAGMLEQVLMNSAIHSRQACPKGGRLLIDTRVLEVDQAFVREQPAARPGRYVCLTITDCGGGDDIKTTAWLFEPFFTTREGGSRSGLGLATVYGIVKQHQGWVDVVNLLNQGRSLKIYLPATRTLVSDTQLLEKCAQPIRGGTETILLVEPDQLLGAVACSILERYAYQVLPAASGAEALALWRNHSARIQLLLVNLRLPDGMNAADLAQRLQAESARLKVLYTGEYRARLASHECQFTPGLNFLPKPCTATALAQAVRQCLDAPNPTSSPSVP